MLVTTGQRGGRKLGQGKKGATYTIQSDRRGDDETACRLITDLVESGAATSARLLHLHGPDDQLSGTEGLREFVAFLGSAKHTASFIGKRIVASSAETRREEFRLETEAIQRVARAFGDRLGRRSTLGAPAFRGKQVYGLALEPCAEFFVFSSRCGPSLDRFRFDDASVRRFVADILAGFEIIHGAGLVHGDVKLDNMIFCKKEGSAAGTFKLIDWGLAESAAQLKARYAGHRKPKNYSSPMSWYVWGMWRTLSWATYLGYYLWKAFGAVKSSPAFRAFLLSAGRSFDDHLASAPTQSRGQLLRQFVWSFDLFNLGITFAMIATSDAARLSADTRAGLMELATRLTHYGRPDFLRDAASARRASRACLRLKSQKR